ncbi:hypothetical protein, partial [Aurantivibrio infirmus]
CNQKMKENELLTELEVHIDEQWGPSIRLSSYEHQDYIDDVTTEHFDMLCELKTCDDETGIYVLHFGQSANPEKLENIVRKINQFHGTKNKIYETIV